jgi:hypothetical protein
MDQPHERFDAGHFIQEEIRGILAITVARFIADNPLW